MFERESNREKNLEKNAKEAKAKARKEAAKTGEPLDKVTDDDLRQVSLAIFIRAGKGMQLHPAVCGQCYACK